MFPPMNSRYGGTLTVHHRKPGHIGSTRAFELVNTIARDAADSYRQLPTAAP